MKITISNQIFYEDIMQIIRLFFSASEIENNNLNIDCKYSLNNDILNINISICNDSVNETYNNDFEFSKNQLLDEKKYIKRNLKIELYNLLSKITGKTLPWGSLTGVRPTRLFYDLKDELKSSLLAKNELINTFKVSPEKAEILMQTVKNQTKREINDNLVSLYISIPFCTTKCYYCTFISQPIKECENLINPYIKCLLMEIDAIKQIILDNNYIVKSIYIGGGTPTSLNVNQLELILSKLTYPVSEFTVEAGRPDSITEEKLNLLKKYNVTRISINPQTFSPTTLKKIGRGHSVKQIYQAFDLAKNYNFVINTDLIAGLDNESFATFKNSLQKAIDLHPDNITIHTLTYKRTSLLSDGVGEVSNKDEVNKMISHSYKTLIENNYNPYYLYKQKNMLANLENVGYSKPQKQCVFNIDSMEDVANIIAVGASAISKRYYSLQNKLQRLANVKNLPYYIDNINEIIAKKQKFFKK